MQLLVACSKAWIVLKSRGFTVDRPRCMPRLSWHHEIWRMRATGEGGWSYGVGALVAWREAAHASMSPTVVGVLRRAIRSRLRACKLAERDPSAFLQLLCIDCTSIKTTKPLTKNNQPKLATLIQKHYILRTDDSGRHSPTRTGCPSTSAT